MAGYLDIVQRFLQKEAQSRVSSALAIQGILGAFKGLHERLFKSRHVLR